MHNAPVARKISLSALAALTLLVGALFLAAVAAPKASAGLSQCSPTTMCVWEDTANTGRFSWWNASDRGCHDHRDNPNIRTAWNRTPYSVQLGGRATIAPGNLWTNGPNWNIFVTGVICW